MESAFGGLESGIWQQMDLSEVKMTELLNMASQLVQSLFCKTVHSCCLSAESTSATPASRLHVTSDIRPCSSRHESKGESQV